MREIGRVINIERGIVSLALESEAAACAGCAVMTPGTGAGETAASNPAAVEHSKRGVLDAACPVCAAFATEKTRTVQAVNRRNIQLEVGDRVVVHVDSKKTVAAALLVFVLPLAACLLGYAIPAALWPSSPEEARLLVGAGGFALSYLFAFVLRAIRKTKDWPEIVEKYDRTTG